MAADYTAPPPSEAELRAEIRRLQHFLACWNIGVPERLAARLSLRIARAALGAMVSPAVAARETPGGGLEPLARTLLTNLKHLVRWHDQLSLTDIRRAEVSISEADRIFGGESPISADAPTQPGGEGVRHG